MSAALILVIVIVVVAYVFDYTNGFHDAANSIATVVSTRVLSPQLAVFWAAFFNFVAFAILGTRVAKTIGGDLVHIELIAPDRIAGSYHLEHRYVVRRVADLKLSCTNRRLWWGCLSCLRRGYRHS